MKPQEPRKNLADPGRLGPRLRELRRAAGLTQSDVARRMGYRDRGGKTAVSRLEHGKAGRPGLDVVRRYLGAVGAGWGDLAGATGQAEATEARAAKPARVPEPKPPKTTAERIRAVERRARRLYLARMFEGLLYELFTSGEIEVTDDERARLARHAREVFRLLERHELARERRRRAAGADPDLVALVERFTERVFAQMWRAGDFARRVEVDAAAVVAGTAYLSTVWRVEERLKREAEQEFVAWGRKRARVMYRIWEEGRDFLRGRGVKGGRLTRLSAVVGELCGFAAGSEPGSKERRQRQRELGRRMKDPKLAREMCALVFGRWDELRDEVPGPPGERPQSGAG